MIVLDNRYTKKHKDTPFRNRIQGNPSTSRPPSGAPSWAIERVAEQNYVFIKFIVQICSEVPMLLLQMIMI